MVEVLNITAWSDVTVQLPHVTLTGVHGWDELGSLLAQRYISNVTTSQVCPKLPKAQVKPTMAPYLDQQLLCICIMRIDFQQD